MRHLTPTRQSGFTLLEVIVALTITGFVLGGLFSLVAGSKQLTFRSESNLDRATQIRATTNFALLQDEYYEVEPILRRDEWEADEVDLIEPPERKTQPTIFALQEYEISHEDRDEIITGARWVRLESPQ